MMQSSGVKRTGMWTLLDVEHFIKWAREQGYTDESRVLVQINMQGPSTQTFRDFALQVWITEKRK